MAKPQKTKAENLPAALLQWATDEMKFHTAAQSSQSSFKLPSEEDFKFLCSGPLVDVWKYVIEHVKSVQNAKHIKGNVELKRTLGSLNRRGAGAGGALHTGSEEERERRQLLTQQKSRLLRELQQTQAEVSQLHRELGHTAGEMTTTELAYQSVCQRVRDLQRRESVLQVAQSCAAETTARYAEYTDRVDKSVRDITDKKQNFQENFVSGSNTDEDDELETESCHLVRHACEDISTFIYKSLDGVTEDSQLKKSKSDLYDRVERAAAVNSTWSLVSALAANAERAGKSLRQNTAAVDISKDAEEISFSYDPREGLQDLSSPPSASDTVKQLMLASSEQHVLRWFKEQEHLNEEWKLSSRQTETLEEIDKLLNRVIGDHPSHIAVAKGYVDARVRLAEERAVAPCLRKEASRLVERIDHTRQERQELKQKYAQIQDFQKLVGKKQGVISSLAKLNATASDRLQSNKQQVEAYLESRSLLTHLSEVQSLPSRLKGALISELDCFLGLLMPCLLTVNLDSHTRMCALDLSISPAVHALAYERFQTHSDICKALEFPAHKSIESLTVHILNLHSTIQRLQAAQKQREVTAAEVQRAAGTTDDIGTFIGEMMRHCSGLRQAAEQHDRAQCERLLPRLEEGISITRKHVADMDSIRKTAATWWEQPAQWTTPWVRSGGLTFDQWMQRWRKAMTQVHIKLMDKRGGARLERKH